MPTLEELRQRYKQPDRQDTPPARLAPAPPGNLDAISFDDLHDVSADGHAIKFVVDGMRYIARATSMSIHETSMHVKMRIADNSVHVFNALSRPKGDVRVACWIRGKCTNVTGRVLETIVTDEESGDGEYQVTFRIT